MTLEYCNLRDLEFRRYFISYLSWWDIGENRGFLSSLEKKEITDKDLIRAYLDISFVDISNLHFSIILFNYKATKISKERINKFYKLCREVHNFKPNKLLNYNNEIDYVTLSAAISDAEDVNKLMDIFLEQI